MNNLSTYRNKLQITQTQLAEIVGVSRTTIQNIESDTKIPSVKLAIELANCLQCKVEDIFDYSTKQER